MISVIIPTLNEEEYLGRCIADILSEGAECEIIVSDGGSSDTTRTIASGFPDVLVLAADKGRGNQMNRGASEAAGDVLLFLHADTLLERGWSKALITALDNPACVGGAFTLKIQKNLLRYRLIESWVRLRCRLLKLPYGDQGIFVRRDIFRELEGYRNIPLMEDVDLVERMKKRGNLVLLRTHAITHERRWAKKGWIRVSLMNQILMVLYRLGFDPHTLAKLYYR